MEITNYIHPEGFGTGEQAVIFSSRWNQNCCRVVTDDNKVETLVTKRSEVVVINHYIGLLQRQLLQDSFKRKIIMIMIAQYSK